MLNVSLVIWMLFVHWVADFICQTDEMAINKSKGFYALFAHSAVYWVVLLLGLAFYVGVTQHFIFPKYFEINFFTHFFIDGITSRINAKLYLNHRHWFFTMIGFDQFLHLAILFLTLIF